MTKQEKSSRKPGAGAEPKRRNPAIEVVNVYGSGPLPVGLREEGVDASKTETAGLENRGALSTTLEGKLPAGKDRSR